MTKTNFKRIFGLICLCAMLFTVASFSTACNDEKVPDAAKITKEQLFEANNTSKILDQYQTITSKTTSTDQYGVKIVGYSSYHKDVNGNIVMQYESREENGKFSSSLAQFDDLVVYLWPPLAVSFLITDDWNALSINQFNLFSKDINFEIIGDIEIENDKIVMHTSSNSLDETVFCTNYFNKDTYLLEKMESTTTNEAGEITFQSVDEYFYGKQITSTSTAYQVFSRAHVGVSSELKVNYVDKNESRIYYVNREAIIFVSLDYANADIEYKVFADSECTVEIPIGTVIGDTEEIWIKKVTE